MDRKTGLFGLEHSGLGVSYLLSESFFNRPAYTKPKGNIFCVALVGNANACVE